MDRGWVGEKEAAGLRSRANPEQQGARHTRLLEYLRKEEKRKQ